MVAAFVCLEKAKMAFTWIPASGGCILLSGQDVDARTWHKDFENEKGNFPGFLFILNRSESAFFYLYNGVRNFAIYPDDVQERKNVSEADDEERNYFSRISPHFSWISTAR